MSPLIILIREETLPLVLSLHLLFNPQLHLLPYHRFEYEGFLWRHRLPVLYASCIDWPRSFPQRKHDDRDGVLGIVFLYLWDGRNARRPDLVLVYSCAGDLPCQGLADTADFIEDRFGAGSWRYKYVVCEELDFTFRHTLRKAYEC